MKLTKQFIVVYNEKKEIISISSENSETYVGNGMLSAEFDTQIELDSFIVENQLKHVDI